MDALDEWMMVIPWLRPDEAKAHFDLWLAAREAPLDPSDIRLDLACGRDGYTLRRYSVRTTARESQTAE